MTREVLNRSYISDCYNHIKDRLELQDYNPLEPLFLQSMSYLFDELDKSRKETEYWKLSFNKMVELQRRSNGL